MTRCAGLSLGTAQWGMAYGIANRTGRPDPEAVREMLDLAREAGVRRLDTARAYGESEAVIGSLIGTEGDWHVTTKLAPDVFSPGTSSRDALWRTEGSLERSRAALQRHRLDVLLLHRIEHKRACDGALWRRLLRERDCGGIGRLGVSASNPAEAWDLLIDPEVAVIQVATSLLDQRLYRDGFFERARALEKEIQVRSVFLQGAAHLAPGALPPHLARLGPALATIRRWAVSRGITPREAFISFARSIPGACVLVGCERPVQLLEVLGDWQCGSSDGSELRGLAAEIPALDAALLDPSLWREQPSAPPPAPAPAPALGKQGVPGKRTAPRPGRGGARPTAPPRARF